VDRRAAGTGRAMRHTGLTTTCTTGKWTTAG
jgi:hypothetical protein